MTGFNHGVLDLAARIRKGEGLRARDGLGLERVLEEFRREARASALEEFAEALASGTVHATSQEDDRLAELTTLVLRDLAQPLAEELRRLAALERNCG